MTPVVIGLDLSLTATGYAYVTAVQRVAETIKRPQYKGNDRLRSIRTAIVERLGGAAPELVVVENYAYGRPNQAHQLGELHGVVRLALDELDVHWVLLTPATVKKYATGKGNASKNEMLAAAIKRLGYDGSDGDQADALWLACAGHQLLGHPVVDLPQAHLVALRDVDIEVPAS